MVFTGPPDVGKTEVARILGAVLSQMKLLRKGHVVEIDRAGLVAGYVAQTATTPALLAPWLDERMPRKDWSNGREMRSLLERMREAQALRISAQDTPDLNALTEQDLTAALSVRRVKETIWHTLRTALQSVMVTCGIARRFTVWLGWRCHRP